MKQWVAVAGVLIAAACSGEAKRADGSTSATAQATHKAQALRFDFRGLHLHDSVTAELRNRFGLTCIPVACGRESDSIGPVPVSILAGLVNERVSLFAITFEASQFSSMVTLATEKWGPATDSAEASAKAPFPFIMREWKLADGTLTLANASDEPGRGVLAIASDSLQAVDSVRADRKLREAAKTRM